MPQTPPVTDNAKKHGCYVGRHRWTTKGDATTLTCYYCGKPRTLGKTLRCYLGLHWWVWVGRPGGPDSYRECRRCKKMHLVGGLERADDFNRSGMDAKSLERSKFRL